MELFALLGVFFLFGLLLRLAIYANGYYSDNRIMRTRQLAYIKKEVGTEPSEEESRRIENARWNIMLDK